MNIDEVIKVLKEYNKWSRGKGRKYQTPGYPFDSLKIGEAIDAAIRKLSLHLEDDEFLTLTYLACQSPRVMRSDAAIVTIKKAKALCRRIQRMKAKTNE